MFEWFILILVLQIHKSSNKRMGEMFFARELYGYTI